MAALGAETTVRRPFLAAGSDGEVSAQAAPVFLAADENGRPVDPMIWGDEKRMKRELVAWAKAVASMAASKDTSSSLSSPLPPSMRRRG